MLHSLQLLLQRLHLLLKVQSDCIQMLLKLSSQIMTNRLNVLAQLLPLVLELAINSHLEIAKRSVLLSKPLLHSCQNCCQIRCSWLLRESCIRIWVHRLILRPIPSSGTTLPAGKNSRTGGCKVSSKPNVSDGKLGKSQLDDAKRTLASSDMVHPS